MSVTVSSPRFLSREGPRCPRALAADGSTWKGRPVTGGRESSPSAPGNPTKHCHYLGYVEGIENSIVALSTCSGLRGFLQTGETYYGIEPLENSKGFQHLVYRMEDLQEEASMCGVSDLSSSKLLKVSCKTYVDHSTLLFSLSLSLSSLSLPLSLSVISPFVKLQFEIKRNTTAIREEAVQIANYIDGVSPNSPLYFTPNLVAQGFEPLPREREDPGSIPGRVRSGRNVGQVSLLPPHTPLFTSGR
uniref:Disintegrin and metalloproteinase domain-containing protein 9-like n=1 Tax=Callorhinchus milii TaxID=7868 RepID=A0A4W3HAU4_CALMI